MMRKKAPIVVEVSTRDASSSQIIMGESNHSSKIVLHPRRRLTLSVILPSILIIAVLLFSDRQQPQNTNANKEPQQQVEVAQATGTQQKQESYEPDTIENPIRNSKESTSELPTTSEVQQQQQERIIPEISTASSASIAGCTTEQLTLLRSNLFLQQPETLSLESRCPSTKWLAQMLELDNTQGRRVVGVNVGCNKAVDAIGMARQMGQNPIFNKRSWVKMMQNITNVKMRMMCAVWGGANKKRRRVQRLVDYSQVDLSATASNSTTIKAPSLEYHCIEPMPSTNRVLKQSADILGLQEHGFHVHQYVISNTSGTGLFPNSDAGTENMSAESCGASEVEKASLNCEEVPMLTLDDFAAKHLDKTDNNSQRNLDVLSIDTEGFDLPVLRGARAVLERTRYLEFEYHGVWAEELLLKDAVDYLEELEFICYFAGQGQLFKVTGTCWINDLYEIRMWSNVACVHRSEHAWLQIMERTFANTLVPPDPV